MSTPARVRISSIDALRGLVMVIMVLDHARDFYFGPMRMRPTDLTVTTPLLFFTRWITHFCAPVFVFLAGTSAFLYARKHPELLTRFLLTRGAILIALEVTVIRLCWVPDPFYHFTLLQVIWATGWSMVLLGLVCRLPLPAIAAIGGVIMLLHNTLDGVHPKDLGSASWLWSMLHERSSVELLPGRKLFVTYPIVPWFGIISLGFGFGSVMVQDQARRVLQTRQLGFAVTAAFLLLRAINVYGDHVPWTTQSTPVFTLMSFLNCEKYPPSLLYTLMTLGPALLLLSWLDETPVGETNRLVGRLVVLGSVPLFFYVAHLLLLRCSSAPLAFMRFGPSAFGAPPGHAGSPEYDLWVVYVVWIATVLLLYPAAVWFRAKKQARPDSWLRYF